MNYRFARLADVPTLAEASMQFLVDTGARHKPKPAELEKAWIERLGGEHRAVLFENEGKPAAYALYRPEGDAIRLEQFFVRREERGRGVGRAAFLLLREEVLAPGSRIQVEAPADGRAALDFLRAMGFADRSITLQLETPREASET